MKKHLITAIVMIMMLSLNGCWWFHHRHNSHGGDRDGYTHHDNGRDHDGDRDRYHDGNKDHDPWR